MPRYEVVLAHRSVRYRKIIVEAMSKDAAAKKAKAKAVSSELIVRADLDSGWGDPMEPKITTHTVREIGEG